MAREPDAQEEHARRSVWAELAWTLRVLRSRLHIEWRFHRPLTHDDWSADVHAMLREEEAWERRRAALPDVLFDESIWGGDLENESEHDPKPGPPKEGA